MNSATIAALMDRRLQRRDLVVYGVALRGLSYYHPLPLKVRVVAREARMHYADAARAIRRLCALGYLEPGPPDGPRRTYLLREEVRTLLASGPTCQVAA